MANPPTAIGNPAYAILKAGTVAALSNRLSVSAYSAAEAALKLHTTRQAANISMIIFISMLLIPTANILKNCRKLLIFAKAWEIL